MAHGLVGHALPRDHEHLEAVGERPLVDGQRELAGRLLCAHRAAGATLSRIDASQRDGTLLANRREIGLLD